MKTITREIKMNVYTFANVDVANGALINVFEVESVKSLTRKEKTEISKNHGDAILVKAYSKSYKYSLPVENFIKACEDYAKQVENGEAEPITDEDEEYNNEGDNN